jgi:hypothetical protein
MEPEGQRMVSSEEIDTDHVIVLALRSRLVATENRDAIDRHFDSIVRAEQKYLMAGVLYVNNGTRVGDPFAIVGLECSSQIHQTVGCVRKGPIRVIQRIAETCGFSG